MYQHKASKTQFWVTDVRGAIQAHNELKLFELNKLTVAGKRDCQ